LDGIDKGWVKVVNGLCETVGRLLVAGFVEEVYFDVPALHWETFLSRRLITERKLSAYISYLNLRYILDLGTNSDVHISLFRDELHGALHLRVDQQ
jgi:hypothetical protein